MITLFELCAADRDIRFSPAVWRTRLNLLHKGLPFEGKGLKFLEKDPLSPAQSTTVPVIKDGDIWVKDSFDICCYLDETYPENPIIPGGKAGIPAAQFFNTWTSTAILTKVFPMVAIDVCRQLDDENAAYFREGREKFLGCSLEDAQKAAFPKKDELTSALNPARLMVKEKSSPFLNGTTPAFADYCLMGVFAWVYIISDLELVDAKDPLYAWQNRMMDLFDGHIRSAKRAS